MFKIDEIIRWTKGRVLSVAKDYEFGNISIDSRDVRDGAIFIAIKGKRYDGHDFAVKALMNGASCAIVEGRKASSVFGDAKRLRRCIISVKDTIRALGDLAALHRRRFDIPSVAVTGSCGKTTTKDMIGSVLKGSWRPLTNAGTKNNAIGVPLTILTLDERHDSLVVELGMNHAGEIRRLAEMSRPNVGVVTNVGPCHIQYLGNMRSVYKAKKELLDYLDRWDSAILNNDDNFLCRFRGSGLNILRYGIRERSDYQARKISRSGNGWSFEVNGFSYSIPSLARHDIYNALAAICVGRLFNVSEDEIRNGLSRIRASDHRMNMKTFSKIRFIDDSYNSNPLSLESAVKTLSELNARGRKILVLGDMLELGAKSKLYHERIGKIIAGSDINEFIAVGPMARNIHMQAAKGGMKQSRFCNSKDEAVSFLKSIVRPYDVVLVKGSRATKMEEIIECFITSFTR
ncbi:MAG: UDP-N-acetylmuramoyl-tripeptide--D-alanyl-D-alanine ligase [Candidatus Omnitrophica bacterium]|nr:UDP-N-acetylmuramoyl-tripeptide--D-alanyl-D-alanine ligase [Candidatus Omnitrophota bacterium]